MNASFSAVRRCGGLAALLPREVAHARARFYAFGCAAGTEKARGGRAATVALIAAGVAVCALGEGKLSRLGLAQQLGALACEALRLTLVQVLMSGLAAPASRGETL